MSARRTLLVAVLPTLILICSHIGLYQQNATRQRAGWWIAHTYEVIGQVGAIESGLALAESALRGYVISHEPTALTSFEEGLVRMRTGWARAVQLTRDNPENNERLRQLEPTLLVRADQLREVLSAAREHGGHAGISAERMQLTNEIRGVVAAVIAEEQRLLEQRVTTADQEARRTQQTAAVGLGLSVLLVGIFGWTIARQTRLLKDAEEELRLTVDNAPIGIALVGTDGRWLRVNDVLCRLIGYTRDELLRTNFQRVTHPDDLDADLALVKQLLAGAIPSYEMEKRYICRDRSIVWVHMSVSLVRDRAGLPKFFVAQIEDVSERRSAESQARLFFEQSADLLAIAEAPHKLMSVNGAWARTLGWSERELIGTSYLALVHLDDHASNKQESAALAEGRSYAFRKRFRAKDGRYHWLDWKVQPTQDGRMFCIARDVTEQVEREQVLHLFQRALAATASGVMMTDPRTDDNCVTYVNPAFERMTGYSAAELIGKSCRILQGQDRDQPEIAQMREAVAQERECQVVLRNYKKSGEMFMSAIALSPVRDQGRNLTHYIGIVEDVTARQHDEDQLRMLAELTRMVAESSDVESAQIAVLRGVCETQGWECGELWSASADPNVLVRQRMWRTPELAAQFQSLDVAVPRPRGSMMLWRVWDSGSCEWHVDVQTEEIGSGTHLNVAQRSGLRCAVGVPLFVHGKVEGVLILGRRVSMLRDERLLHALTAIGGQLGALIERKRAEQALAVSEERLSHAVRATSDVIYDHDLVQKQLWLAETLERAFGHSVRTAQTAWWTSLIHPDDLAEVQTSLNVALAGSQSHWTAEYRLRTGSGYYAHVFDRAFILRAADGRATRVIGSVMDISERVRHEVALREAKLAAESATRAKSNFLANMSHEIRTPLTAMLGFAELLLEPNLSETKRLSHANTVRRNGEHLLSVLNDILDIAKVEAGKLTLERVDVSIVRLITEVASLMRVRALEKQLTFEITYDVPLPAAILSDPTRLKQIVLNLVSNAVKFTQEGGVRVHVACKPAADGDMAELKIEVSDTGIGMEEAQIERLFLPFSQGDASTTRRFGGSGLGLAICAPLIRAMDGTLDVESVVDQGSTFRVRLPVHLGSDRRLLHDPKESLQEEAATPELAANSGQKAHGSVLLAEDGRDNQALISALVRKAGFDVDVVENGALAVQRALSAAASGEPYDLILMDMQMPELDGYQATSRLRAKGYTGQIVAVTAHAFAGERERCLAAGCDEYLSKPIRRGELAHVLHARAMPSLRVVNAPAVVVDAPTRSSRPVQQKPAPVEPAWLVSELAEDPEMFDLVSRFAAGLPAQMSALSEAVERNEQDSATRLAHQLKGAAGGYGYPSITTAAARLEQALKRADAAEAARALNALNALCGRVFVPRAPSDAPSGNAATRNELSLLPRVLVIDDSVHTREQVAARLGQRVLVQHAPTARDGLASALAQAPDLVLLDLDLPDKDGFQVCRELKNDARTAHVPVLFLTSNEDPAVKAEALDLGACDYVTKPFDAVELAARVRSALRMKRYQELLAARAQIDGLTGLWNRAYFDARLEEELSSARRHARPVSVAMIDLDHFKKLNDAHGHPFGDHVLQMVAKAVTNALRQGDVACRYGGEEIVVILRDAPASEASAAAERIRRVIEELQLEAAGRRVPVTASLGVASIAPEQSSWDPAALVGAADAALYEAKRAGRNRVVAAHGV